MPPRARQGKCEVHKGLLLHVDAPVKQIILDLNTKHGHHIVINSLPNDERKIFVSREFEDASGHEQDTLTFLQVCAASGLRLAGRAWFAPRSVLTHAAAPLPQGRLDHHLENITYNPDDAR